MAPLATTYTARCATCGTIYEGPDAASMTAIAQEHARHGVQARSEIRCSGCGASAELADTAALKQFVEEHFAHGTRCATCGGMLSVVDKVGTCPACGHTVHFHVSVNKHVEGKPRRRSLFGR